MMGSESSYERIKKLFDWVEFDGGRAKFDGGVRGGDELGHDTFAVELPGSEVLYGEFRTRFEADKTHYNVEIVRFGYGDRGNVDNEHPRARKYFTPEEAVTLERVITALMVRDVKKPVPIEDSENFLGKVIFRPGWLQVRPR
jgi:hypothetical protein